MEATSWDGSLRISEMFECVYGHIVCDSHINYTALPEKDENATIGDLSDVDQDEWALWCTNEREEMARHGVQEEMCPICKLDIILDSTVLLYICCELGISKEKLHDEIRLKYNLLRDLEEDLKRSNINEDS
jgi:hypothetical protein